MYQSDHQTTLINSRNIFSLNVTKAWVGYHSYFLGGWKTDYGREFPAQMPNDDGAVADDAYMECLYIDSSGNGLRDICMAQKAVVCQQIGQLFAVFFRLDSVLGLGLID